MNGLINWVIDWSIDWWMNWLIDWLIEFYNLSYLCYREDVIRVKLLPLQRLLNGFLDPSRCLSVVPAAWSVPRQFGSLKKNNFPWQKIKISFHLYIRSGFIADDFLVIPEDKVVLVFRAFGVEEEVREVEPRVGLESFPPVLEASVIFQVKDKIFYPEFDSWKNIVKP